MIKEFEIEFLKFVNRAIPTVKSAIYAEKDILFEAFNNVKKFPSFYFNREVDQLILAKGVPVYDGGDVTTFFVAPINYEGSILVEKQAECLQFMSDLRFYWYRNPYLQVNLTGFKSSLPVQLRLLYIKLEELRSTRDDKGPIRYIHFKWQTQQYLSSKIELPTYSEIQISVVVNNEPKIVII